MRNRLIWVIDGSFKSILTTSSWTIAGRKTKLLTNAGTTAEGVQGEVVRSLAQVLRGLGAWRGCWGSARGSTRSILKAMA